MRDSGQFSYRLERVVGRFVRKEDDGYGLRQAGTHRRGRPLGSGHRIARRVAHPGHYFGSPVEVSFRTDRVVENCTECAGKGGTPTDEGGRFVPRDDGYLGALPLPSSGIRNRTMAAVFEAVWTWTNGELLTEASGMCSRCSAPLEASVTVCEPHDATEGLRPV